ncbi:alpha/beta fold hydrolase [Variovorax sp. KK3]|uniref:alpha/beta fold hydrolase n=1 Tax=Variovorax sp. KK3 TaxID=1855728 RepID=UPI00097C6B79|nr:alpha/beta hydrolase [Variovorax sp. KK3]
MTDYKETPVQFGPDGSLIGIITTPADGPLAPVACLMLNMGANHRIGPRRINVKLARQMAARGMSSVRLDLAGLGDSGPASGSEHFLTQAVLDLQAAMNLIQTMLGVRRFIVIGLCSGATNGLSLAVADARVVGLLMFDGYAFPGRRAQLERQFRRALAVPTNPAVIGKTVRWLKRKFSPQAAAAAAAHIFEPDPPEVTAAIFRRSMTQVAERNVSVLLFYTGTVHVVDRGRDQLGPFAQEDFTQRFEYRFIGDIDHSLTSMASQQTFMEVVCDWALRVVQGATAAPAGITATTGRSTQQLGNRMVKGSLQHDVVS